MSTLIGVISDTHGLLRPEAMRALEGVERILHAGDVGGPEILDALGTLAPVTAVRGNTDHGGWALKLPETELVEVESATLFMLHDLGGLDLDPVAAGFQVIISGHTHRPVSEMRQGVLYLNPGSAGPRRFRLPVSLARIKVAGRKVDAELIELNG
ncbi:MAG TPA: metallophosphoesterase family protein [Methylomirabilota bacterium]|nr:metallophosphoesterase family protein [Methylomirabilota bacterium]